LAACLDQPEIDKFAVTQSSPLPYYSTNTIKNQTFKPMTLLKKILKTGKKIITREYVRYNKVILPPRNRRYLRESYYDDKLFYDSTVQEGNKFIEKLGVTSNTKILEIGCTTGRSFIGLVQKIPDIYYIGVDIFIWNIEWCKKYLGRGNPNYNFHHFDLKHVMYNPNGKVELNSKFRFQYESDYFDLIYATGVIPNYIDSEVKILLRDFNRMLKTGGRLFLTSFTEDNVPDMEENPAGYLIAEYTYPRQIVRFEKKYFEKILNEQGFKVDIFEHRKEIDFQSGYYLTKMKSLN
jgi:cyclopropane fatty-acyl-phospholipid synthase-like methyltransferase